MTQAQSEQQNTTFAHRLASVVNSHDLDALVGCFSEDYVNETPAHPSRGFRGREQVRRNWSEIFARVPDIVTTVLRADQIEDRVWSEWEMRGTRVDGLAHLMRGVMLFTLDGDRASAVRFYLEPVEEGGHDADQAARRLLDGPRS